MSYPGSMLSLTRGIQINISLLCMFTQMFSRASRYCPALSGEEQASSPWPWVIRLASGGWEIKLPEEEKLIYFLGGCSHHWATVWTADSSKRTTLLSAGSGVGTAAWGYVLSHCTCWVWFFCDWEWCFSKDCLGLRETPYHLEVKL